VANRLSATRALATLEAPHDEPLTLAVDATLPVDRIAEQALAWWRAHESH